MLNENALDGEQNEEVLEQEEVTAETEKSEGQEQQEEQDSPPEEKPKFYFDDGTSKYRTEDDLKKGLGNLRNQLIKVIEDNKTLKAQYQQRQQETARTEPEKQVVQETQSELDKILSEQERELAEIAKNKDLSYDDILEKQSAVISKTNKALKIAQAEVIQSAKREAKEIAEAVVRETLSARDKNTEKLTRDQKVEADLVELQEKFPDLYALNDNILVIRETEDHPDRANFDRLREVYSYVEKYPDLTVKEAHAIVASKYPDLVQQKKQTKQELTPEQKLYQEQKKTRATIVAKPTQSSEKPKETKVFDLDTALQAMREDLLSQE